MNMRMLISKVVVISGSARQGLGLEMSRRLFATKTPDRAAVHGVKQPPTHTLQSRERIEEEIEKTAEEEEKKRKEVEQKVESHLNKSHNVVSNSPQSLSSS